MKSEQRIITIGREFGSAFIDDYTELKSVMVRY